MEYDQACFEIIDNGNFIRITPLKLAHEDASDWWDKDWIKSEIEVKAGSFMGKFRCDLRLTDLNYLKSGLENLYTNLNGELFFEDIEHHLRINIKGDNCGHFEADCTVSEGPWSGKISFFMTFDQTQVMPMVRDLNAISSKFSAK